MYRLIIKVILGSIYFSCSSRHSKKNINHLNSSSLSHNILMTDFSTSNLYHKFDSDDHNNVLDSKRQLLNSVDQDPYLEYLGSNYSTIGNSIKVSNNGGFLFSGKSSLFSSGQTYDTFAMNILPNGNISFVNVLSSSENSSGDCFIQLSDGSYILSGNEESSSSIGDSRLFFSKFSSEGNLDLFRSFKIYSNNSFDEYISDCISTYDNGFVLVGKSNGGYGIMTKFNSSGDNIWTKKININNWIEINSVIETNSHNLVIVGSAILGSLSTLGLIACLDDNGDIIWSKGINSSQIINGITELSNYDLGIVGYTDNGVGDILIGRVDLSGNILWLKAFGGAENNYGNGIVGTSDNGIVVVGTTNSFATFNNFTKGVVIKLDDLGTLLWSKILGISSGEDAIYDVEESMGGHIVFTGSSKNLENGKSHMLFGKLNSDEILNENCDYITGIDLEISNISDYIVYDNITYDSYEDVIPIIYNSSNYFSVIDAASDFERIRVCQTAFLSTDTPAAFPTKIPSTSPIINRAPLVISSIPTQYAYINQIFEYTFPQAIIEDPDMDQLTYSVVQFDDEPLPNWLIFSNGTNKILGIPSISDIGTLFIKYIAQDPYGLEASEVFGIVVGRESYNNTFSPTSLGKIRKTNKLMTGYEKKFITILVAILACIILIFTFLTCWYSQKLKYLNNEANMSNNISKGSNEAKLFDISHNSTIDSKTKTFDSSNFNVESKSNNSVIEINDIRHKNTKVYIYPENVSNEFKKQESIIINNEKMSKDSKTVNIDSPTDEIQDKVSMNPYDSMSIVSENYNDDFIKKQKSLFEKKELIVLDDYEESVDSNWEKNSNKKRKKEVHFFENIYEQNNDNEIDPNHQNTNVREILYYNKSMPVIEMNSSEIYHRSSIIENSNSYSINKTSKNSNNTSNKKKINLKNIESTHL